MLEAQFEQLSRKIDDNFHKLRSRLKAYLKRLLFPLWLFPIKIVTYSLYYLVKFTFKLIISFIDLVVDTVLFPFRSLKNFLKSIFIFGFFLYILATLIVISDYLHTQYGYLDKFLCSINLESNVKDKVVRVVGGYSEGSGFFIAPNQILTNFHVIADEPSPKIIFPNGKFVTPTKIIGDKIADLAILYTESDYHRLVMPLQKEVMLVDNEPIIAAGYPLGTSLTGDATLLRGRYIDYRVSSQMPTGYIQSDINLVEGMSGGPLLDQCGQVIGVNTLGLSGLSLFIHSGSVKQLIRNFTDQDIQKINVDPSLSPEAAVEAFYTYLKARNMEAGFDLLSSQYLEKTDYREWTRRFRDVLDVDIIAIRPDEIQEDTVQIKFGTKNWKAQEVHYFYYEGTWQTVFEDGKYKMLRSNIKEIFQPEWSWYYQWED